MSIKANTWKSLRTDVYLLARSHRFVHGKAVDSTVPIIPAEFAGAIECAIRSRVTQENYRSEFKLNRAFKSAGSCQRIIGLAKRMVAVLYLRQFDHSYNKESHKETK